MDDIILWEYQQKLTSADDAVKIVKSGDLICYSEFVLFPKTLDAALARRIGELDNIVIRGTSFTRVPEAVTADMESCHIIMEDYHFGTVSRELHKQKLSYYVPITLSLIHI